MAGPNECYLVAAGTDGTDGLTTATGAIVDNLTIEKGLLKNLDVTDYLNRADSHSYFKQTEGLITTGASGTNVMDLVLEIPRIREFLTIFFIVRSRFSIFVNRYIGINSFSNLDTVICQPVTSYPGFDMYCNRGFA